MEREVASRTQLKPKLLTEKELTEKELTEKDKSKTKGQLLQELAQLRQRVAVLESRSQQYEQSQPTASNNHKSLDGFAVHVPWDEVNNSQRDTGEAAIDATELKLAEIALQRSLKDLADIKFALDQSSIVAVTDAKGIITYVNDKFCELSQYDRADLIGESHRIINSGYHPKEFFQWMWATISGGQVWQGDIKNRAKDGSFYWVTTTIVPFLNAKGKPYQYIAIRQDITDHKHTEAELRQSEERFRATFEQASVGIAHVALDGRWLLVNQRLCSIVGYSREELLQKTFQDLTHPDDLASDMSYVHRLLAGELHTYSLEKRYICKDGSLTWIDLTGSLVCAPDGTPAYFIAVIQDIRDRKAAETALQQLNATLEQRVKERTAQFNEINQELKRFAYTVSHDLRSPLRAIRGLIEALVEDYGNQLDETGREYTQLIAGSARRMDRLIQDLLAYSRLTQTEIQLQPVLLTTVLHEVLNQLEPDRQAKQAEIAVAFPLPCVIGQATILTQVLINLLTNALKYVATDVQPQVRVWAEVAERRRQKPEGKRSDEKGGDKRKWIRLWVADNGIGIEADYLEQIFGVFERLHPANIYEGTGVGLAIVQKGIERLGGRVGVESQPGQGSRFWVELPAAECA